MGSTPQTGLVRAWFQQVILKTAEDKISKKERKAKKEKQAQFKTQKHLRLLYLSSGIPRTMKYLGGRVSAASTCCSLLQERRKGIERGSHS